MRKNVDISRTNLPRNLKEWREERCLTQSDLADMAGLSGRTIHDLEAGKRDRVQAKTLMLLAKALEIPYDDIFTDSQDEPDLDVSKETPPIWWKRPAVLLPLVVILVLAIGLGVIANLPPGELEWSRDSNRLVAGSQVLSMKCWERTFGANIFVCEPSPWSADVILVGLAGKTAAGGRLLALDRETGHTLWEVEPDRKALARAFGNDIVYSGNYNCHEIVTPDLNGDGTGDLVVHFGHSKWYPNALCFVDQQGRLSSQYASYGNIYDMLPLDLDGDGKEELVVAATNNAKAYQGAMVFILDEMHRSGASVDAHAHPESSEPDSALVRIVFPQFQEPFMEQMNIQRLMAAGLRSYHTPEGSIELSVVVGAPKDYNLVVCLDHELRPLSAAIGDAFQDLMKRTWSDSLLAVDGPGDEVWRNAWLDRHLRFEAGHWPVEALD